MSTAPRDAEKRPAYERYHALAQPPTSSLVLPYRYKVLAEIFRCLETVVVMLYNRKECIYFEKIKPAVQKMLQRYWFHSINSTSVRRLIDHLTQGLHTKALGANRPRLPHSLQAEPRKDHIEPELLSTKEALLPTDPDAQLGLPVIGAVQ